MSKASDFVSSLPLSQMAIVGLGLVAVALPFVGWRSFSPSQMAEQSELALPAVLPQRVAALGRVTPQGDVIALGAPINEIVADLTVKEGDWVNQGDVVAYLRSATERLAEFEAAQQKLATARAQLEAEASYGQAQIEESSTDYEALPAVQAEGLSAQQAVVNSLSRELAFAQQEFSRYDLLYRQGALSKNDIDQRQTSVDQLVEQLRQEEAKLQQQEATRDRELANARTKLNTAQASAERSMSQTQVEAAAKDVELAKVRVENSMIRAPTGGRVLRVITQAGETVSDNGSGKGAIIDMANTEQMTVVAEVYEANIGQIQIGQPAIVTSRNDVFDGELTGTVSEVGNQLFKKDVLNDDPTARVDVRVVEVTIRLDQPHAVARLNNLQVDVEIDTE